MEVIVLINFTMQSNLLERIKSATPAVWARREDVVRPWTATEWVEYFRANAGKNRPIPWERGREASTAQLLVIARSLQAWQLGETSDGRHLRAAAARYAEQVGEPDYLRAVDLFIREEQRHGEMLGRFLDLAGVGRVKADWGDRLFRAARYFLPSMETWTTPVVMVEVLALIYYNAIRRATASVVLSTICAQILTDEVPHIRFQCERLASILRGRGPLGLALTMLLHRLFFLVIVLLVWLGHRRALRAGGYGLGTYWRVAWAKMRAAWRMMDPRRYAWPPDGQSGGGHGGGAPSPSRASSTPLVLAQGGTAGSRLTPTEH
jgi:hypothetical protein